MMELSHYSYDITTYSIAEMSEQKMENSESERPDGKELPYLENNGKTDKEWIQFNPEDSERNIEELPHLENEREQFSEDCSDNEMEDVSDRIDGGEEVNIITDSDDTAESVENDNVEDNIEKTLDDYFEDLKDKSECSDTIPDKPFDAVDLIKLTPEENEKMREEFDDKRNQLKRDWEEVNGRPWPKYDHDVYSSTGKLIRKAGSDYDAHHIQPLGMGGKNDVGNITPLSADVHYDKQGVHAPDSPYSKLDKMLGGVN